MLNGSFEIWTHSGDFARGLQVAVALRAPNGQYSVADPLVFRELPIDDLVDKPTVGPRDGRAFLQAALNEAWRLGMRPEGFLDTTNQVAALSAHLADMRMIVGRSTLPPAPPRVIDASDPISPELTQMWAEWMKAWGLK